MRVEGRALNPLQDRVVLTGVPAEVRLDGNKLWMQEPFPGQNQRLSDARDSAVSIAKWMDRHQVEVSHRPSDHGMTSHVAGAQPLGQFSDEPRDFGRWRGTVGITARTARHDHRSVAQSPRSCIRLRVADQEMELENCLSRPSEVGIVGQCGYSIHGLPVRGDDPLRLLSGPRGMPARKDFNSVLDACPVTLDRGRTDRRLGRGKPSERPGPRLGRVTWVLGQEAPQSIELGQPALQLPGLWGRRIDRHGRSISE